MNRTVAAYTAGGLLLLAGVLSTIAAGLRWAEPCAGSFDAPACNAVQDHLYDFVVPSGPWAPIPGAAQLAGAGFILVAVALVVLFWLPGVTMLVRWAQATVLLLLVATGLLTGASGVVGRPLVPETVANALLLTWAVAGPVLLLMCAWHRRGQPLSRSAWLIAFGCLMLATPLLGMVVSTFADLALWQGYSSYDTAPWADAVSGGMWVLAGLAVVIGTASVRWTRRPAALVPS